jgi:hypothetical protein
MNIAICPDIHGTHCWLKAKDKIDSIDKVIILGDIFDNWSNVWPDQMTNAKNIVQLKKDYPNKVDLLWANHDTSYFLDERCSGYQVVHALDIKEFFRDNKQYFQAVSIYDNWIFSHAGISAPWMSCCGIKSPFEINQLFLDRPNYFRWVGPNGYGRNDNESPMWIRENLKDCNIPKYNQVIGHTELQIENWPTVLIGLQNEKLVYIDTKEHNKLLLLDTITNKFGELQ